MTSPARILLHHVASIVEEIAHAVHLLSRFGHDLTSRVAGAIFSALRAAANGTGLTAVLTFVNYLESLAKYLLGMVFNLVLLVPLHAIKSSAGEIKSRFLTTDSSWSIKKTQRSPKRWGDGTLLRIFESVFTPLHAFMKIGGMVISYLVDMEGVAISHVRRGLAHLARLHSEERRARGEKTKYEREEENRCPVGAVNMDEEKERLGMYVKLASLSLGDYALRFLRVIPKDKTGLEVLAPGWKMISTRFFSSIYCPGYMLLQRGDELVLSIRGSTFPQDAVTDLMCMNYTEEEESDDESFGSGGDGGNDNNHQRFYHGGVYHSAMNISEEVREVILKEYLERRATRLILTGHSLGAAVAALLTVIWSRYAPMGEEYSILANARCVAVASPCVASLAVAQDPKTYERVTSIINGDDVVCRLGLSTMKDLGRIAARLGKEAEWKDPVEMRSVVKECLAATGDHEKLYPCGRILLVDKGGTEGEEEELMREVTPQCLGEIIVSPAMFVNHLPQEYFKRFFKGFKEATV